MVILCTRTAPAVTCGVGTTRQALQTKITDNDGKVRMKGRNELVFNQAQMAEALESYLNRSVFSLEHKCRVASVQADIGGSVKVFRIAIEGVNDEHAADKNADR